MIPAVTPKQPLPPNPFGGHSPSLYDTYEQCLAAEAEATSDDHQMYARCLGYLLIEAPDNTGRKMVAEGIILCKGQPDKLFELARFYIRHVIGAFKRETPIHSNHPSRLSFDENGFSYSEPGPECHTTAKHDALRRDSYSCMVSGQYDLGTYVGLSPAERAALGGSRTTVPTNFCHILPPPTNWHPNLNTLDHPKIMSTGNAWCTFGGIGVLDGAEIHKLSNGLTLSTHLHPPFNDLHLWFEAVPNGPPHTYLVRSMCPILGVPVTPITFTSSSPDLELPDPRYLKLHAAICRVAQMAGVAEYLEDRDDTDTDMQPTQVLASDGSSMGLLTSRLERATLEHIRSSC